MLIADIAKQASVSPSTVSRAINQPEIVAPESLARIRAVMKKHDYTPAPLNRRRGPKTKKPTTLRLGVWFVGAKAGNPSLNWFQERITDLQERNPRNHVDLHMLFWMVSLFRGWNPPPRCWQNSSIYPPYGS